MTRFIIAAAGIILAAFAALLGYAWREIYRINGGAYR